MDAEVNAVLSEVFSLQANIAEQVTRELNVAVGAALSPAITPPPTTKLEAYQAYLLGVYQDSPPTGLRSGECARHRGVRASGGSPSSFALAHARLSIAHPAICARL